MENYLQVQETWVTELDRELAHPDRYVAAYSNILPIAIRFELLVVH